MCSFVRFNSSETAGSANTKLDTIEHCLGVRIIRGLVMSSRRHNKKRFFVILHFVTEKNGCLLKRKSALDLLIYKKFYFLVV